MLNRHFIRNGCLFLNWTEPVLWQIKFVNMHTCYSDTSTTNIMNDHAHHIVIGT